MADNRTDNRTRLSLKSSDGTINYKLPLDGPAKNISSAGIIFPYTPTINYSQTVKYSEYELIHTNYAINSYVNSRLGNITISAPFINQTETEAKYTYGAIHFLRVVTKMHTGSSNNAGTPPPVLEFSSYGQGIFNRIPVLVGSFSTIFPNDVDYIKFEDGKLGIINLPVTMEIQIELIPQYSAQKQNTFSIQTFATGESYKGGYI